MMRAILLSTALAAATLSGGTAYSQTQAAPRQGGPAQGAPAPTLAKQDRDFLREAAMGGMLEVQLGQLAQQKAANDEVKKFGQRMVDDHTKVDDRLNQIAQQKSITLPKELDKKGKQTLDRLSKLAGPKFDKEYMSDMVREHTTDLKAFEKQAKDGRDADLKDLASTTVPTLREHLTLAKQVNDKVKGEK